MNIWIIIGIVIAVIVIIAIMMYNSFVSMKNKIDEAFSTMDVYLKKRYDLIPNLVETVKGYAKHESETLENVIKARNMAMNSQNMEDKINGENMITSSLKSIFALAESYPDLKANENFNDLQNKLNRMEDEIASSRKYYNAVVKEFNTKTEQFPSSIIANMFGFSPKPFFEIADTAQRENITVKF